MTETVNLLDPREEGFRLLPTADELNNIHVGSSVKLCAIKEQFWVCITSIDKDQYEGIIDNNLISPEFNSGDKIKFQQRHICDTMPTNRQRAQIYARRSLAMMKLNGILQQINPSNLVEGVYRPNAALMCTEHDFRCNIHEQCELCGKYAGFLCANCKVTWYCSKECQKQDWKVHKRLCEAFQSVSAQRVEELADIIMRFVV